MNLFLLNRIFNKKLIKGFPPCTDCPDPNSDCNKPCGCGGGGPGGCGSGGGGGGGQGGGSGGAPRGAQTFAAAPGSDTEVSMEIFDDPNFAENILSEVEEFLAVGQGAGQGPLIPSSSNNVNPGDIGGGAGCSGGGGCGGCGGGGGGGGIGFGGSITNPGVSWSSQGGGMNVTVTPYGTPSDGKSNIFCFTWNY